MEIYGKERGFFLSVGAKDAISRLDSNLSVYMRTAACAVILNEQYNKRQRFLGEETPDDLTLEMVLSMDETTFEEMCAEMNKAIEAGNEVSVEVEEDKKKEHTK